jgi:PepSY-associated TM region
VSFNVLNRKVHYWASAIFAVPLLVIIVSGLFLQAKKHSAWVQPPEQRGTGTVPGISFDGMLESLRQVPGMHVASWADVNRIDVRPGRGVAKVWLQSGYEVQVDLGTGAVLQTAYRRSDLIESIHDGSFFGGDWTKLGLFLPTGLTLLLLWFGGLWMFWVPFWAKRKRKVARRLAKAALAGLVLGTVAALGMTGTGRSVRQAPAARSALEIVPIVGHWERDSEGGEAVVRADATKWDRKPAGNLDAIGASLFKKPGPAFVRNASSAGAFPVAAIQSIDAFRGGVLRAQFKLVSGATDQLAGIAFDLRDSGEYFAVRYNTKDGNVALWRYADGARARVADGTDHAQLPLGVWHTIELRAAGRTVTGVVNDTLRVEHALDREIDGRVGFWAKPDSVSAFKAVTVR